LKNQSLFELARVLGVFGGLLTLLAGILDFESLLSTGRVPSPDSLIDVLGVGTVLVGLGALALVGSGRVRVVVWDILLVMVGVLAFSLGARFPWEWGSILVILGGMVGIIGRLA
jgi:hypothetical protein